MNEEENTKQPEITDDSLQPGEIISEEMAMPEKKVTTIELPQTKDMEVHHHAHDPAAPHHKKNWKSYFWNF